MMPLSNFLLLYSVPASETVNIIIMKKIGIIALLTALIIQGFSQEVSAENKKSNPSVIVADSNDITKVVVGQELLVVEDGKSAVNVRVGSRGVTILESLEGKGPKIEFKKFGNKEPAFHQDDEKSEDNRADRRSHFKGHWAGVEFGFNNYLTSDKSLSLPVNIDYMNLHSGKSNNFNINFSQISLGITRRIGLVTGLGLNWNNYRFDGNNNIQKGTTGIIEILDPGANLEKSKLVTLYLNLPLLFEIQIPADHSHINLAGGPLGAVKLHSHSKMVFEDGDKVKSDDDFSLNMLRYGATARIGYENFQIYGTYYMNPLFKSGKGPDGVELFPFEIGIAFTID